MDLTVPVILGTARDGRESGQAAKFVVNYLQQSVDELSVELVDVRDFAFGQTYEAWNDHPGVPQIGEWKDIAERADGFVIVTPEYNHGYPGELKVMLDAAYEEYFDKPVGLVGVSAGGFGGARVVEHVKPILIELGMAVISEAVYVSDVGDTFTDDGGIEQDKRELLENQIDAMAKNFLQYAQTLSYVREEASS